jgi:hypothetical protein
MVRIYSLQLLEFLSCAVEVAFQRAQFRAFGLQLDAVGLLLQRLLELLPCGAEIAHRLKSTHLIERCDLARRCAGRRQVLLDELFDLRFREDAYEMFGNGPILEKHDGGQTADTDFLGQIGLLICIHFGDDQTPGELSGDSIEDR